MKGVSTMILFRETPVSNISQEFVLLRLEDNKGFVYVSQDVFTQAILLKQKYDGSNNKLRADLKCASLTMSESTFLDVAPKALKILGPFVSVLAGPLEDWSIEKIFGALHRFSEIINFTTYYGGTIVPPEEGVDLQTYLDQYQEDWDKICNKAIPWVIPAVTEEVDTSADVQGVDEDIDGQVISIKTLKEIVHAVVEEMLPLVTPRFLDTMPEEKPLSYSRADVETMQQTVQVDSYMPYSTTEEDEDDEDMIDVSAFDDLFAEYEEAKNTELEESEEEAAEDVVEDETEEEPSEDEKVLALLLQQFGGKR